MKYEKDSVYFKYRLIVSHVNDSTTVVHIATYSCVLELLMIKPALVLFELRYLIS